MLRSWRRNKRIGFFPDGIGVDGSVQSGAPAAQLARLTGDFGLEVVLSSHFVRYAVLPWSSELTSEKEWMALAQLHFSSTYGTSASNWAIQTCATGRRKPRVACAVDEQVIASLRRVPRLVSVQPALMAAFNDRREAFSRESGWFVVQEPGRLTLSLIVDGDWKLISCRQARTDWRTTLPALLDREHAMRGEPACERVVLHCQDEPPPRIERYRIAASSRH